MQLKSPTKTFIPAPPTSTRTCNECPHVRLNTMEKLYLCMKHELPEVTLPQWIIDQGRTSIDRMLDISKKAGLGG